MQGKAKWNRKKRKKKKCLIPLRHIERIKSFARRGNKLGTGKGGRKMKTLDFYATLSPYKNLFESVKRKEFKSK